MFSFFGSKKVIGLDIGTSTIKMAELEFSRGSATLNAFAMSATPPQSVAGGDILDPSSVSQTINALAQELQTKRKMASVGLWGSSVIVKKISIPRMDEKVVGEQIRWEAEQYIPFDINEVNLQYKILKGLPQSSETMDILVVAARREQAFRYAEVVETAGYQCAVLDVGGFALANCFELNYGVAKGEAIALLNIGASVINLLIIESGEVVFCRDLPVGGLTYTGELQKALSVSIEEAESIKLSAGAGQAAPEDVPNILRQTNEMIGEEIRGSFDFFMNTNASSAIKRCYLSGGGSKVLGLAEHLSKAFSMPVQQFDPLAKIKINEKTMSAQFASEVRDYMGVALGLGIRKPGDE